MCEAVGRVDGVEGDSVLVSGQNTNGWGGRERDEGDEVDGRDERDGRKW